MSYSLNRELILLVIILNTYLPINSLSVKTTVETKSLEISTNATEIDCIFPFLYNGNWSDKCVQNKNNPNTYWCSLDKVYTNRAIPCEQSCPLLARQIMENNPSATHTSCLDASPTASSLFPDSSQIEIILAEHNKVRASVNDPPAADMRAAYWDYGLARLAQRWAEHCVFDHDCTECSTLVNNRSLYIGQNAYAMFGASFDPATFWVDVLKLWSDEKAKFQYDVGAISGNFADIGHYTQLVNNGVGRVGCGAALCDSSSIYAYCNYALGQSEVNRPYTSGPGCSLCPNSKCVNNLCQCDLVCQNSGVLDVNKCTCTCDSSYEGSQCETKKNIPDPDIPQ